jgi:hypothetical protein
MISAKEAKDKAKENLISKNKTVIDEITKSIESAIDDGCNSTDYKFPSINPHVVDAIIYYLREFGYQVEIRKNFQAPDPRGISKQPILRFSITILW